MMIFQFLAYLSQKAIVQGFKTEKTLRLENGVPNPNIFQERSFPSCSVFHLLFFLQGVGKTQKPKTKVRASERLEGLAAVAGLLLVPENHRFGRQFPGRLLHPSEMSLGLDSCTRLHNFCGLKGDESG